MNGRPVCLSVVMFPLFFDRVLLWPNMVSEQEEGDEEGSQQKRMEERSKSAFSDCFGSFFQLGFAGRVSPYRIFGELHLSGPQCRWFLQTCVKDAAWITVIFVSVVL